MLIGKSVLESFILVACVAWRFWLGALSNKGGRGQRNREEIRRSFSRASRANFAATPLLRPGRQNRHATQAIILASGITASFTFTGNHLLLFPQRGFQPFRTKILKILIDSAGLDLQWL